MDIPIITVSAIFGAFIIGFTAWAIVYVGAESEREYYNRATHDESDRE